MHVDAFAHYIGQIQAGAVFFEYFDNPAALFVVAEGMADGMGQGGLAGMSKRRMANVMSEANCFDQVFIESQSARNSAGDLGNFKGMRQAGAVVVTLGRNKYLGFVFEAPEWLGMQYAVAVTLEASAYRRFGFGVFAGGSSAFGCIW